MARVLGMQSLKNEGELGGLVLDVWDNEPSIDTEVLAMTDCRTSHIAGISGWARYR
jgi:phosphoglycerate dehydrogenase-like enzyme